MARNPPTELKRDRSTDRAFVYWKKRKFYFGKWGSREASKAFSEWLHQVYKNPTAPSPQSRITVVECIDLYLEHASRYYSVDGVSTQEFLNVSAAMQTLWDHADGLKAAEFGPRKLIDIQNALSKSTIDDEEGKPIKLRYARNTINARIHRIRRCFRWCASQEYISADIVTALEMVPAIAKGRTDTRETLPVESVPISVVRLTLPFVSPTVSAMVRVQMLCGMRPQDVCGMTGGGITRTGDIWLYRPTDHKTAYLGKELVKAIPPAARSILEPLLRDDATAPIFSPLDSLDHWRSTERRPERKPVVSKRSRTAYTTASYGKSIVYGIARAAKAGVTVPHWTPNQLRHSIATQLRGTAGIEAAQLFLGHSKPDTTLIYAERSVETLSEIARQLVSPFDDQTKEHLPR